MNAFAWFFLSLRGRVGRQEFWLGYAGVIVVALILMRMVSHPDDAAYLMPSDAPDTDIWQDTSFSFGWLVAAHFRYSGVLQWPAANAGFPGRGSFTR